MKYISRAASAIQVAIGMALCASNSAVYAQSFADDFTSNTVNFNFSVYSRDLANPDTAATVDDSGVLINIIHADPDGGERAVYELNTKSATNSVRSTGQFLGVRPTVGNLRYESEGRFYNSLTDFVPGTDSREGEVEVQVGLNLGVSASEDSASVCFQVRDADDNSQPLEVSRDKCQQFQIAGLDVNTPYTIEVGVSRTTQELFAELNGERISVSSPTPFYESNDPYAYARFRVRDGAESAEFRMSSLSFDGEAADLSSAAFANNYQTSDFDNFENDENRSKEVVDGRLRLSTTVTSSDDDSDAFLRFSKPNDYIEADLVYSGESTVDTSAGGFSAVRIAGLLYNDTSAELDVGNLGTVWGAVMLVNNAGSGLVGEYCAIRSDTEDFSESTDLADGLDDSRCPMFELAVTPDTVYKAILSLDQEAKTITYTLGEEVVVYDITTDIFKRDGILRAQTRMSGGATGTTIGYFDNLRNDPIALTDEELSASLGTGSTNNTDITDDDSSSVSSTSSGGGCSVGVGQKDYSLYILLLLAFMATLHKKCIRSSS